ncbi:HAMP domain-containing histidine kinase, partial [bacterium]|nr:HAMP domain-containing histidine kinase [bacterium]
MKEDTPSHQPVSAEQGTYAYDLSETWRAFIVVNALLIAAWLGLFALEKWQQPKHNPASLQQSAIALGDALQTDLERDTFTEQEKQSLNALFAEHGALHSASIALSNGEALYLPDQASFRSVNNIGYSHLLRWQQTLALPDDDTATITVQQLATGQRDMPQYSPYLIAALIIFNTLFAFRVRQYLQQKQLRQQTSSDTATGSSPSNRDSLSPASSEATQHTIDLIDQLTIERNELRLAQQTAVQSSQLKSKLIADTSHELLTPLNSIVGFSQLLSQSNDTLSEDNADYVQRIHHNAQHLTAIVNDMLDLSRLESGRLQLNYTSTDIYSLLFSVVYSITLDAEYKKLHVVTDLENLYGVSLSTDALRLRQIVTNLLSNAIRYTSTGFVRLSANIETNRNTQWLRVDVTDSGPGISPAQRERIFNRFNGDSADTVPMSTGLGLSIANDLVNAFGGKLSLSQPAEGGSEFTVILPLDEIHRAQATVQEDKPKVLLYCGVNGSNEISSSTHHASSAIYRAKQSQLQQYQRILAEIAEVDTYSAWTTFY